MTSTTTRRRSNAGFTIIELLIATAVFAVIILVITVSILQFSNEYYKGIIASSTQESARTIIDDVTRSIEFNSGAVSSLTASGNTGYCIGTAERYSYALDQEVTDSNPQTNLHQGQHGLVSDSVTGCNTSTTALSVKSLGSLTALDNGRELLGEHMRLAKFTITGDTSGNLYTIDIKVVYGDDNLLTSPTDPNMACKSTAGSQFCAVSELTTTVRKRVD